MDGNKVIITNQKEYIVLYNNGEGNVLFEFDTVEEAFLKKIELEKAILGVTVYRKTQISIHVS